MAHDWSHAEKAKLFTLWVYLGRSMGQIAAYMGVSRNSVSGQIKRLGLVGQGHRMWGQRVAGRDPRNKSFVATGHL